MVATTGSLIGTKTSHFNMIVFLDNSNLLDVSEGIILHGCNAQGVMGSGVAKQLRAKYMQVYIDYQNFVAEQREIFGSVPLGATVLTDVSDKLAVASAITQNNYGYDGKQYASYVAIDQAVRRVLHHTYTNKYRNWPVHIPYMIGAGLGGGDLCKIKTIIEDASRDLERNIYCHIYRGS